MRILYITFEKPSVFYGGGRAIIQSLESLSGVAEIDYIGLPFNTDEYKQFNIKQQFFLNKSKNLFTCVKNIFMGLPTFYYSSWKKIIKKLNLINYNFVFIEFSHLDFVVKWAKRNNLKVITRVHNIESDMLESVKKAKQFNHFKLRAILNGNKIYKREKRDFILSDKLIFLTKNDMQRACSLYNINIKDKSTIIPICMPLQVRNDYVKPFEFEYALITGSLNYGANLDGIIWFIKNVWQNLLESNSVSNIKLVVAGSNPTEQILSLCNETKNCIIVNTPIDIAPYLNYAKFFIAPIFTGAGMKVKVAEALSYGLKVVGTDHAFIGYETAEKFLYRSNNVEDFITNTKVLINERNNDAERQECKDLFKKEFTMEHSKQMYEEVINNLLN